MGRGIARKAALTKKCSCDKPEWFRDDIEVNGNTKEITYKLMCRNCGANWGTKTIEARKYWLPHFDKIPTVWMGYGYKGNKTVRELFDDLDNERLTVLEKEEMIAEKKVLEAQSVLDKTKKNTDKFKKQLNDFLNEI